MWLGLLRASRTLEESPALVAHQQSHLSDLAAPAAVSARLEAVFTELLAENDQPEQAPEAEPWAQPHVAGRGPRPHLAVASPFPPLASGVADHTAFIVEHLSALADVTVCPTNTDAALPADARYEIAPLTADVYLDRGFDAVLSVAGNSLYHVPVLEYLAEYGGACLAHDNRMVEVYVA